MYYWEKSITNIKSDSCFFHTFVDDRVSFGLSYFAFFEHLLIFFCFSVSCQCIIDSKCSVATSNRHFPFAFLFILSVWGMFIQCLCVHYQTQVWKFKKNAGNEFFQIDFINKLLHIKLNVHIKIYSSFGCLWKKNNLFINLIEKNITYVKDKNRFQ